ncbi:hypothetical protein CGRAC_0029 [Campylobacter gracilis]|uniref:Uncharacterized protein n=1 Tax=Campylobacter gracilis RM3268 TaxID=553220 RepID=C8PKT9_9BACT|nr:hypothetical protein CGRAC_0029 [Campylobacter gracilis]EEV16698.1 hypothetical protein CAMGR0001_0312 [Campylobacter gracilis RM3268]
MGLRAALGLSAAALEFCRDKDLPQREILNYRRILRTGARHFPHLLDFKAFLDIIINIYF